MRKTNFTFLVTLVTLFTATFISAQSQCPEFQPSQNIFAGLEIGSRGMKPSIVRFEEAESGKTSFIVLSRDLTPMNTNPAKAKTREDIDCTVDRILRYVNVFRNDPYNVPDSRISLIISSGLKAKLLDAGKDSLLLYLKDRVKRTTNLSMVEISDKEEGDFKVQHLMVDEECTFPMVNVLDIGSGNVTGGFASKTSSSSYATDAAINNMATYAKDEMAKRGLSIKIPRDRSQIAQLVSDKFQAQCLGQIKLSDNPTQLVAGGGMNFVLMSWFKAESFSEKRLNPFFLTYVYDFYTQLINSTNNEEFFKNNRAKDNSPLSWKGKQRLKDAQAIFNDTELLVGAAIMKTVYDDLVKRGVKEFYFDDQMLNSGLRYFQYQKYKNAKSASTSSTN